MRKERNCRYGNENTDPQAVGSTLNPIGADKEGGTLCRRKQHKKRLPLQSRHMGNTTLGVTAPPYDEIAQEAFSVWELFEGKYR